MGKIRLLIDIDGVLRNYVKALCDIYKREYPDHQIKPITSWNIHNYFPIGKEIYEFADKHFAEEIFENAIPYPGSIEALHQYFDKFKLVLVTAQKPEHRHSTFLWLGKHKVPSNEVHIEFDKYKIDGFALLDDYPVNLEKFQQTGRLAVCLDQSYNQDWKGARVKSVAEFFAYINVYVKENNPFEDQLFA